MKNIRFFAMIGGQFLGSGELVQLIEKALPSLLRLSFSVQARLLGLCLNLLSCPAFSLPGAVLHKGWTIDSKRV